MKLAYLFGLIALLTLNLLTISSVSAANDANYNSESDLGAIAANTVTPASPSAVVTLTDDNFDKVVQPEAGTTGDWFVEFYAPWCGHCKTLEPIWSQLATKLASSNTAVHVGALDATQELYQAKRFDVRGFPTLKLFSRGKVYEYKGPRNLEALEKFALSAGAGSEAKDIPEPPHQIEVFIEWFITISGDVQTILLRKPVTGGLLFLVGMLVGIIASVIAFTTCIEKIPQEYVQYKDQTTGQILTVPYVRPSGVRTVNVASTTETTKTDSSAPTATSGSRASKKKQ